MFPPTCRPLPPIYFAFWTADIDELKVVRKQLVMKYGQHFVEEAVKNGKQEAHFKVSIQKSAYLLGRKRARTIAPKSSLLRNCAGCHLYRHDIGEEGECPSLDRP